MPMKRGRPAPEPMKTASKPSLSISESMVTVRPATTSVSISTPRRFTASTSAATTRCLGNRNSGMPYTNTPPTLCSASKIFTLYPARARSLAQASPDGPEPITATLPLYSAGFSAGFSAEALAMAQSPTKRSSLPMLTGSPLMPNTHEPSHWVSCGHTRPHTAGRLES